MSAPHQQRLYGLSVVPDVMGALSRALELTAAIGALDPEHECEAHGRIEGDSTPPCGCFPGEHAAAVLTAPAIAASTPARPGRRPPPSNGRVVGRERSPGGVPLQIILCTCGATWQRPAGTPGRVPACPDCRNLTTKEN